ncbi:MAG: hypothetical protein PG981_000203 [Wolbachia endosymbiont of Ctenocephalides orientis wCori]|nr:MAG: hypothetical protein PG981_000203 [Wolbachia endosymbiont of Ctenocephalides orientis wCori]
MGGAILDTKHHSSGEKLAVTLAKDLVLQDAVAEELRKDPGSARGPRGSQGKYGHRGQDGEQGADGAPGRPGKHGHPGAEGPQGEKGERGADGAVGSPGPQGEQGERGARGFQGLHGRSDGDSEMEEMISRMIAELTNETLILILTLTYINL